MSQFRGMLRALAQQTLLAAGTLAGTNVFLPRDWPLNSARMPAILLQTPNERKESRGKSGTPQYEAVTWLQARCQLDGDDPARVEGALEALADQVELAILGLVVGPPQLVDQVSAIETEMLLSADGKRHIGEVVLRFAFQYPEDFVPSVPDALAEITLTTSADMTAGDAVGQPLETLGPAIRIPLPAPDPMPLPIAPPFNGAIFFAAAGGSYLLAPGVGLVIVQGTPTAPTVLVLPQSPTIATLIVKDQTGQTPQYPITVSAAGNLPIDGQAAVLISAPYASLTFVWTGQSYAII